MSMTAAWAAPEVSLQFFECIHQSSPQRIEVDVTYPFKERGIFFTDD
jgi:hypothetical protein